MIHLNAKKIFVGTLIASIFFIDSSKIFAENVEVFGGEFENSKPAEVSQSVEEEQTQVSPKVEENRSEFLNSENDDDNFGDTLNFDDLNRAGNGNESPTVENPLPTEIIPEETILKPEIKTDTTYPLQENVKEEKPSPTVSQTGRQPDKQKKLKLQKPRFTKLTMDESYIYFLDNQSVSWKKIPYFAEEYMADVWIRMIERDDDDITPEYELDEVTLAKEEGKQLPQSDIEVLQHKKYFLEHYYLRPKTEQIQFISELEIVDRPQNTTNERKYDFQNWEYLIPGSTESAIYHTVIKVIGKSKASERGHMTFTDMLEEYARISVR